MTTAIPTNYTSDVAGFIQTVFVVQLSPGINGADENGDFSSYADIYAHGAQTDTGNGASITNIINDPQISQILNSANAAAPSYFYSQGKCRDTSIGGNDAINCYPQFNETDDVAEHPFLSTTINDTSGLSGMGRVYSEVYDDQQQIMYLTFGVPKFNNLNSFYSHAIFADLAQAMNSGGQTTAGQIGTLIGEGINFAVSIPTLPLVFIYNALQKITDAGITKYYDFRSAMPLYYRCVNSMLLHLSVNMGLMKDNFFFGSGSISSTGVIDQTSGEAASAVNANMGGTPSTGLPDIFQPYGLDIYKILLKKYIYAKDTNAANQPTSDYTLTNSVVQDNTTSASSGIISNIVSGVENLGSDAIFYIENFASDFITPFASQLYDASLYIGFRIEKGVDTSETFTNTTGQSSIAQTVNSQVQSARDTRFTLANGSVMGSAVQNFMSAIGGVISGLADSTGLDGIGEIMAGNGMVDFPDVWKDSSSSKNYTFNMSLRSPYGDQVSILQNLYFPLVLLLAGALPRAVGQAAYTSPFICRAYCKGMFAIPLGMISNITVKRGADQFGWATSRLPTCLEINFEIKDLSPAMYMGISDSGTTLSALQQIFSTNSNYQEYLMTLSGMGLAERILILKQLRLKVTYLLAQITSTKLSPFYWGYTAGNTLLPRVISNFIPSSRLPLN